MLGTPEKKILSLVKKNQIRKIAHNNNLNLSEAVFEKLNFQIGFIVSNAINRAKGNKRKTILVRDL